MEAIVGTALPDPRDLNDSVSETTARAIKRATEKERNDRFQSIAEFEQSLPPDPVRRVISQIPPRLHETDSVAPKLPSRVSAAIAVNPVGGSGHLHTGWIAAAVSCVLIAACLFAWIPAKDFIEWQHAASSGTQAAYAQYLYKQPGGAHREDAHWHLAQIKNTREEYAAHLLEFPDGHLNAAMTQSAVQLRALHDILIGKGVTFSVEEDAVGFVDLNNDGLDETIVLASVAGKPTLRKCFIFAPMTNWVLMDGEEINNYQVLKAYRGGYRVIAALGVVKWISSTSSGAGGKVFVYHNSLYEWDKGLLVRNGELIPAPQGWYDR